jgi:hypothetical protein
MRVLILIAALLMFAAPVQSTSSPGFPITGCDIYGGGIKLFNLDYQQGTDRVFCGPADGFADDNDFDLDNGYESWYDVGAFDNKAESARLRAKPGCLVAFEGFTGYNRTGTAYYRSLNNTGSTVQTRDVDLPDNVLSSGYIQVDC